MKKYSTILIGLLITFQVLATKKPSCDSDSYSSAVVKEEQISETCVKYEIKVSYDGTRSFGLSHYSIAIPCGEIKDASNSENWKMEFGKDRTTGVYGLKVDNINGFGDGKSDSFTVTFTWCSSSTCDNEIGVVAYKFGQCVSYDTLSHSNPPDPTQTCSTLLASLQKTDIACATINDGKLQAIIDDGEEPIAYAWSNGASTPIIENLSAGIYSVTITDAKGNTLTLSEEISAPAPIVISESVTNPSCSGQNDGAVALTVSGGLGVYTYLWNNGSTAQNQINLPSGFYSVTVTDESGCSALKTMALANGAVISAEPSFTRPTCTKADGSIDIMPMGGTAPYTFLWSTGATTQKLQNVRAGSYLVTITDANGCLTRKIYSLEENNTLFLQYKVTPITCVVDNSGSIDVTVLGGTAPYSFAWADGPTTEDRSGLTLGSYQVTVTDFNGCTVQATIGVNKKPLQLSTVVHQPTCSQDLGSISVTPTDGVPPYTYNWSNGETGNATDGLSDGNYIVTVTDATGCSETQSFFIVSPASIEATGTIANEQCGSEGSFAIDLTPTGGNMPYTFTWSTGATTEDISGLSAGTYSVDIKDAGGCIAHKEFIVDPVSISWSCLIDPPTIQIVCGSAGNILSTGVANGSGYQWTVNSTDNSWAITAGNNSQSVVYTAGTAGSSATFTLLITKNGCTQSCTYTTTSGCVERDNTGGGDPTSNDPCTTTPSTPPVVVGDPEPPADPTEDDGGDTGGISIVHCYPNPFKDKMTFEWTAAENDKVCLDIFDIHGTRVCVLYEGDVTQGRHYKVDWDATGVKDGMHYCRYKTSKKAGYKKLLRIR